MTPTYAGMSDFVGYVTTWFTAGIGQMDGKTIVMGGVVAGVLALLFVGALWRLVVGRRR